MRVLKRAYERENHSQGKVGKESSRRDIVSCYYHKSVLMSGEFVIESFLFLA